MMPRVYVDHATTTPPDPVVLEAMRPFLGEGFGSPLALHARGRRAREAVEDARGSVGRLLGVPPEEIVFTGSATEANNLALKGTLQGSTPGGRVLAAATEHMSVLHPLRSLGRAGLEVVLLPVDRDGLLDPDDLRRELRRGALLVTVAHASGEIGTVQALGDLARVAAEVGVPLHSDATMTAGRIPTPPAAAMPDLVTLTPHLFHGPQGVAALRVGRGRRLRPQIEGGIQEGGLRAGTLPIAAIAGFGAAARQAVVLGGARAEAAAGLAASLRARIEADLGGVVFTGHPQRRLPGHLSLCVPGVEAESILAELDAAGIEAASGSACTTGAGRPSHVLEAIGVDPLVARGALTFMFGPCNAPGDPERIAEALAAAAARLRSLSPLDGGA